MYGLGGKFMEVCVKSENLHRVSLNCGLDSPSTWKMCSVGLDKSFMFF